MVDKLRDRQAKEVAQLDVALKMAGEAGASQDRSRRFRPFVTR